MSPLLALASVNFTGVCEIYAKYGAPCVAAHSLTRVLYGQYRGSLYPVQRRSDQAVVDIKMLENEGVAADFSISDYFCRDTICDVSIIYD